MLSEDKMTKKELVKLLENFDDNLEVWVFCSGYGNTFPAESSDVFLSQEASGYKEATREVLLIGRD